MPFFHQFPNACGLTSLLMALKPASRNIDVLLNYGWDRIGAMFQASPEEPHEYRWQRVLEYLLTACTQHRKLRMYLKIHYPSFVKVVRPWLEEGLIHRNWGERSVANPSLLHAAPLIMSRVNTMKHDVELKILAFLFGCRFLRWKEGADGTGGAFFTQEELLSLQEGHETKTLVEKFAFIMKGLDDGGPVLWGASFHWLAARDLQIDGDREDLFYHDPMGGGDHCINVRELHETDRFYVFQFDPTLLEEHIPILTQAFELPGESKHVEKTTQEEKSPIKSASLGQGSKGRTTARKRRREI